MRSKWVLVAVAAAVAFSSPVFADPPPWAPAHGYYKNKKNKKEKYYVGYSGHEYRRDFDIPGGHCDREEIGAVIGGAIGGVVGNRVADREDRVVGTIIGAALGALVGARVGRSMDERDHGCFGHALEIGTSGRPVRWSNDHGWRYELTPGNGVTRGDRRCRSFTLLSIEGKRQERDSGVACLARPGVWELLRS
jgi:outer membrane lipoprotein SlyB